MRFDALLGSNVLELELKKQLEDSGYKPEPDPQGNLALGYGCVSVQRRENWAAVVRGHSRYLWAAEHYLDANFYGRYLAHGSMQILTGKPGQLVTFATFLRTVRLSKSDARKGATTIAFGSEVIHVEREWVCSITSIYGVVPCGWDRSARIASHR